jgi:hypothetical protein
MLRFVDGADRVLEGPGSRAERAWAMTEREVAVFLYDDMLGRRW